ncbi:hypothetical protein F0H85_23785 [Escherichia coli]|nr:hypothetical protein [Escherichia coli]
MVASGAVCGDAFPGNGLPVRGLWSLIPVLVAFPLILCQQPPVTDRLPRHSIRISSNRGLYCIVFYCTGSGVRFPARLHRLNQIQQG